LIFDIFPELCRLFILSALGLQTSNPKQWQTTTTSELFYIRFKRRSAHRRQQSRCCKPPLLESTEPPNHRCQPIHFLPNHIKAAHFGCNHIIQW